MPFILISETEAISLGAVENISLDGNGITLSSHRNGSSVVYFHLKGDYDAAKARAESEYRRLLAWVAEPQGNFVFNLKPQQMPVCPDCGSNNCVTLSPKESAYRGKYFCPCNEPGTKPSGSGHFDAPEADAPVAFEGGSDK